MKAELGWPSGDNPGELHFGHEVAPELKRALEIAIGHRLSDLRALTPPSGAIGRYAAGGDFLRVGARWGAPELEHAITAHLVAHGVSVNHPTRIGLPLDWEGERLRVDVRPLLDGHHFAGSLAELAALAKVLGDCHRVLRTFPRAKEVAHHAMERFIELEEGRQEIATALDCEDWAFFGPDESWAQRNAAWLDRLVREFTPHFDEQAGAQCVHAQVHRGNVIFPADGGAPVLLDWEWATHTFAAPAWDLAYFVQRFCLHDQPDESTLAERLRAVRKAYGPWGPELAEMMRQTAFHSLVIVVQQWQKGVANTPAEYDKFVYLEEQARTLAPLLTGESHAP